ncbi:BREX system ATP-binding protein BrxD [bacterium CPR1]|nr:BREX system ATP-binding protein BrxD [bacterium CPR1]
MTFSVSTLPKAELQRIMAALRSGAVPEHGLEHFAVGLDQPMEAIREDLGRVSGGRDSAFKFIRGAYGSGKTFLASLIASEAARANKMLVSKVEVSSNECPIYKLASLYRAICRNLSHNKKKGALGAVIEQWLFLLEGQVLQNNDVAENSETFFELVGQKVEMHLVQLDEHGGTLSKLLRRYHRFKFEQRYEDARAALDWLAGNENLPAKVRSKLDVKGVIQDDEVWVYLRGLLDIVRFQYRGLVLILDEAETQLNLLPKQRKKSYEVLREFVDAILANRYPGLYLVVTGTPELFEDQERGIPTLVPLNQRILLDRSTGWVNYRGPQIPLQPFNRDRLLLVAEKVCQLYGGQASNPDRFQAAAGAGFQEHAVSCFEKIFEGKFEVSPRLFLRFFLQALDLTDQEPEYQPLRDFVPTREAVLALANEEERKALG